MLAVLYAMVLVQVIAEHCNFILQCLTGLLEEYEFLEPTDAGKLLRREIAKTLEVICALSVQICKRLKESHLIKVFLHQSKKKRMISQKLCLEPFGTLSLQPLQGVQKYPCAFRSCTKEAGAWMPYSPGRGVEHLLEESYEGSIGCVGEASASPQELVEDFAARLRLIAREVGSANAVEHVVVACSVKCYCRVKAYLYSLGGDIWRSFHVVRGTKQVPKKLLQTLSEEISRRDLEDLSSNFPWDYSWRAKPGDYDQIIDALDCDQEPDSESGHSMTLAII